MFAGDRLPGTPKNKASLTADYDLPLADDKSVNFNFSEVYFGETDSTIGLRGGGVSVKSYELSRAAITYRIGKFEASVFADNLFNKYYILAIDNTTYDQGVYNGVTSRFFGQVVGTPRTVGAEFRVHL